jgi:hypothetical protein
VVFQQRVPDHTYSEGVIRLFTELVLKAACSLRGAGAVLELLSGLWPDLERTPVANTGQRWLLRIGLYELTRPKAAADDWVWSADHPVQIGATKCLLIVGCRLSVWRTLERPLEHRDLEVIALEPVEHSDGATVERQLQAACDRTGIVPRAIPSDEGTDLKKGIAAFCQHHPGTAATLDIAHRAAQHLERELEHDERRAAFTSAAGGAKQRLAQTPLAHLLPPALRTKARFRNIEPLVEWGQKTLRYLDPPLPVAGVAPDVDALQTKLGWLADYRDALAEWSQALDVIARTLTGVRTAGYHRRAAADLRARRATTDAPAPGESPSMAARLATALLDFVATQSAAARDGERLLGSSECLESLIGTGKRLERQPSQSGFTKMILGLAAAVGEPTQDSLRQAFGQVNTGDVITRCQHPLGLSVQSPRREAFAVAGTKSA